MPLTRGFAVGYDDRLLRYKFVMFNDQQEVECTISSSALGDLAERWRKASAPNPVAEFLEFRDIIEPIASELFDTRPLDRGAVRIFAKHLPKKRP